MWRLSYSGHVTPFAIVTDMLQCRGSRSWFAIQTTAGDSLSLFWSQWIFRWYISQWQQHIVREISKITDSNHYCRISILSICHFGWLKSGINYYEQIEACVRTKCVRILHLLRSIYLLRSIMQGNTSPIDWQIITGFRVSMPCIVVTKQTVTHGNVWSVALPFHFLWVTLYTMA
jgi:hypothetical protein